MRNCPDNTWSFLIWWLLLNWNLTLLNGDEKLFCWSLIIPDLAAVSRLKSFWVLQWGSVGVLFRFSFIWWKDLVCRNLYLVCCLCHELEIKLFCWLQAALDHRFEPRLGLPVPDGLWLSGARFPVPAGLWFDWCKIFSSSWPLVDWQFQLAAGWLTQDRWCLVSACSRPPRLPVPAGRWLTDARFPVPAGRWSDWCKIFSSDWPSVYWPQDRLSLVSACSRPPRLPVPASQGFWFCIGSR